MYGHFIRFGWRNLLKHKLYSLINLVGLSLSMSVCLLIILLIYNHYHYDKFHPFGDRTYRILSHKKGMQNNLFESGFATSPLPLRAALENSYPSVELMTNLNHRFQGEIRSDDRIIRLDRSLFADANFFKVFGFSLMEGDPEQALKNPNGLVLTRDLAKKLFPEGGALGRLVKLNENYDFTVTGVLNPPPGDTHIKFDALASFSSLNRLKADGYIEEDFDAWDNLWNNYNYLVLTDAGEKGNIERAINRLAAENMKVDEKHPGYEFSLQGITEVVPGRFLGNEIGFTLPKLILGFFVLLSFIVMITASINYANLTIAGTLNRFKEIGIRKSSGAEKREIAGQFLIESILMSGIALLFAIIFYRILLAQFNAMWIFNQIGIRLHDEPVAYGLFFGFSVLLGLLAGVGPALYASRMDPVATIKGTVMPASRRRRRKLNMKHVMMGVQFGLSVLMLISLFLIRDEARYLTNADYGFNNQKIYLMDLQSHDFNQVQARFSRITGVQEMTVTSHNPGTGVAMAEGYRLHQEDEPLTIYHFSVDTGYLRVMGLQLVAGNNFSPAAQGTENQIIVNELAAKHLGFDPVDKAVGQFLFRDSVDQAMIVGVVKDYHWEPMLKPLTPMLLRVRPADYQYAYVKIISPRPGEVVNNIRKEWKEYDPLREFKGGFLSQEMNEFYTFLFDISKILMLIALMAISITGLGLLGMISMRVRSHIKELGIRKVLGATPSHLFYAVGREFIWLIGISLTLAIPLAIWVNGLWINNLAKRNPISFYNVAPAVLILMAFSFLMILWQVIRALRENPIAALKSEQ